MYKEQLEAYIESKKEDMLRDLMRLVRIDSQRQAEKPGMPFGEGPARVLAEASDLMEQYGLKVRNYDNYVVTGDFGPEERQLDILAHLDVVPVSDNWTVTAPFEPLVRDGRIYGRGTSDDKGPAIAALYAIRAVKDLGLPLRRGVRLILGSDEECGSSDLEYYYSREKEAPCSFTPDADFPLINLEKARLQKSFSAKVIVQKGEPGVESFAAGTKVNVVPDQAVCVITGPDPEAVRAAAAGCGEKTGAAFTVEPEKDGRLRITARGKASHAMMPEGGINAATALLELLAGLDLGDAPSALLIRSLHDVFPHGITDGRGQGIAMADDKSGALTLNAGIITLENGELSGTLDLRIPLCGTDENVTKILDDRLTGAGFTPDDSVIVPAHYVPEDSAFVKTLLAAYEEHFGEKAEPLYTGGGTYVHHLERGVAFGCAREGVDNHMHGGDEFMETEVFLKSSVLFADVIMRLCG